MKACLNKPKVYNLRYRYRPGPGRGRDRARLPVANVGRNHPDYGKTPQEHALAKAVRQQESV